MRAAVLIAAGCASVALAACVDDSQPRRASPRVRVQIATPSDGRTVRSATVDVRGAVRPATAQVSVLGRPALVRGGEFTVVVPLDPGINVVDVAATARRRRPSLTAFRVTREQRVTVPELEGVEASELDALLAPLGLRVERESGGGVLDLLIPRAVRVCEQQPAAGSKVRRGSTVHVIVARSC